MRGGKELGFAFGLGADGDDRLGNIVGFGLAELRISKQQLDCLDMVRLDGREIGLGYDPQCQGGHGAVALHQRADRSDGHGLAWLEPASARLRFQDLDADGSAGLLDRHRLGVAGCDGGGMQLRRRDGNAITIEPDERRRSIGLLGGLGDQHRNLADIVAASSTDRGVLAVDDLKALGRPGDVRSLELAPVPAGRNPADQRERAIRQIALIGLVDQQLARVDPCDLGLGRWYWRQREVGEWDGGDITLVMAFVAGRHSRISAKLTFRVFKAMAVSRSGRHPASRLIIVSTSARTPCAVIGFVR